jgi:putative transposase
MRKEPLVPGSCYHIINKSIAGYGIFTDASEYERMTGAISYYSQADRSMKYSAFIALSKKNQKDHSTEEKNVTVLAYCVMPTHLHLILKEIKENGISIFMSNILNSYARYFNSKHNRKGPLWEGNFKNVPIRTDEQLLHVTRYVHLNPVTAHLVNDPRDWEHSSYRHFLGYPDKNIRMGGCNDIVNISPARYEKFVKDRISYQRDLAKIKFAILE